MIRLFIFILFGFLNLTVFSQQNEHFTQYQHNQFALNPALAGNKKCVDIKSGFRYQWIGIENAPLSLYFSATMPLKNKWKSRSIYAPKHGVGIQVRQDNLGPWQNTEMHLVYGVKFHLSQYNKLSFGLSAGLKQVGFDAGKAVTIHPDIAIFNARKSVVFPDLRIGSWYSSRKAYFGIAIHNLAARKLKNIGTDNSYNRTVVITAGKKFKIDNDWTLIPSFLLVKTKAMPFDGHLTAIFDYDSRVSFGVGIRRTDAITAQVRFRLFDVLSIGYSFDYVISKLQNNSWQSQEISLGYNSCSQPSRFGSTSCPAFE